MGEYTKNGAKMGTCENMYYLRYQDRKKVTPAYGSVNVWTEKNLRWRFPAIEEDEIAPCCYDKDLSTADGGYPYFTCRVYDLPTHLVSEDKGYVQLYDKNTGMLVNVSCYHGAKLPENTDDVKFGWNGKSNPNYMCALKNADGELRICIKCKSCGQMWNVTFDEIYQYILSDLMTMRLMEMCNEYVGHSKYCIKNKSIRRYRNGRNETCLYSLFAEQDKDGELIYRLEFENAQEEISEAVCRTITDASKALDKFMAE